MKRHCYVTTTHGETLRISPRFNEHYRLSRRLKRYAKDECAELHDPEGTWFIVQFEYVVKPLTFPEYAE